MVLEIHRRTAVSVVEWFEDVVGESLETSAGPTIVRMPHPEGFGMNFAIDEAHSELGRRSSQSSWAPNRRTAEVQAEALRADPLPSFLWLSAEIDDWDLWEVQVARQLRDIDDAVGGLPDESNVADVEMVMGLLSVVGGTASLVLGPFAGILATSVGAAGVAVGLNSRLRASRESGASSASLGRSGILRAMRGVAAISRHIPTVLVLQEAHLADESVVAAVRTVVENGHRVLVLLCGLEDSSGIDIRGPLAGPALTELLGETRCTSYVDHVEPAGRVVVIRELEAMLAGEPKESVVSACSLAVDLAGVARWDAASNGRFVIDEFTRLVLPIAASGLSEQAVATLRTMSVLGGVGTSSLCASTQISASGLAELARSGLIVPMADGVWVSRVAPSDLGGVGQFPPAQERLIWAATSAVVQDAAPKGLESEILALLVRGAVRRRLVPRSNDLSECIFSLAIAAAERSAFSRASELAVAAFDVRQGGRPRLAWRVAQAEWQRMSGVPVSEDTDAGESIRNVVESLAFLATLGSHQDRQSTDRGIQRIRTALDEIRKSEPLSSSLNELQLEFAERLCEHGRLKELEAVAAKLTPPLDSNGRRIRALARSPRSRLEARATRLKTRLLEELDEGIPISVAEESTDSLVAICREVGDFGGALVVRRRLLLMQRTHRSVDDVEFLDNEVKIADLVGYAGDPKRAVSGLKEISQRYVVLYGEFHPGALHSRHKLARWLGTMDPPEALRLYLQLIGPTETAFHRYHSLVVTAIGNAATIALQLGDAASARALREDVLERTPNCPDLSPYDVSIFMHNGIAQIAMEGDLPRAKRMWSELLASQHEQFGSHHPLPLSTRASIAQFDGLAGNHQASIDAVQQLLPEFNKVFGAQHPKTLSLRGNLAGTYGSARRYSEAITCLEELLRDELSVYGPDHHEVDATRNAIELWSTRQDESRANPAP